MSTSGGPRLLPCERLKTRIQAGPYGYEGRVWVPKTGGSTPPLCVYPSKKKFYCQQDLGRVYLVTVCAPTTLPDGTKAFAISKAQIERPPMILKQTDLIKRNKDAKQFEKHFDDPLNEPEVMAALADGKQMPLTLVKFFGAMTDDRYLFTVMEHGGSSMADFILSDVRVVPEGWLQRVLACCAHALAHMHSRGYCHRDVKIDNVTVLRKQEQGGLIPVGAKVIDYGSAFKMLPGCRVPAHQPFTPWQFAAPEVMDDKEYDGVKSDVWQLGVMMFAIMIKQQVPLYDFPGRTDSTGRFHILTREGPAAVWKELQRLKIVAHTPSPVVFDPSSRATARKLLDHPWVSYGKPDALPLPPEPQAYASGEGGSGGGGSGGSGSGGGGGGSNQASSPSSGKGEPEEEKDTDM